MDLDDVRAVFAVSKENQIVLVSAGLAFYMFNSLIPLALFVTIAVMTLAWPEQLLELAARGLDIDIDALFGALETVIGDGAAQRRAGLLAVGILIWSAFTMFQSVNMAFGLVYGRRAEQSRLHMVLETTLILLTVIVAAVVLIVIQAGIAIVLRPPLLILASIPLLVIGLFAVFVPMFYHFSPSDVSLQEVLPGAVLTALSWTIGAIVFRIYVVTSGGVELYGVAGAVMLLLTWLYVGALALFVGVVLNAVLARRVDADEQWADIDEEWLPDHIN